MPQLFILIVLSLVGQAQENPEVITEDSDLSQLEGCWLSLYEEKNFEGSNITLFGEERLPEISYSTGPYREEDFKSLSIGETATVTFYSDENYLGESFVAYPSSRINKFPLDKINSLKIECDSRSM